MTSISAHVKSVWDGLLPALPGIVALALEQGSLQAPGLDATFSFRTNGTNTAEKGSVREDALDPAVKPLERVLIRFYLVL